MTNRPFCEIPAMQCPGPGLAGVCRRGRGHRRWPECDLGRAHQGDAPGQRGRGRTHRTAASEAEGWPRTAVRWRRGPLPFRAWLDVSERSATLGVDAGYRGVLSSNPTHTDSMMDGVSAISSPP